MKIEKKESIRQQLLKFTYNKVEQVPIDNNNQYDSLYKTMRSINDLFDGHIYPLGYFSYKMSKCGVIYTKNGKHKKQRVMIIIRKYTK